MYDPTKPYTEHVLDIIKTTFDTPFARRKGNLVYIKRPYSEYPLFCHTDGDGTKPFYYDLADNPEFVIDAFRMNSNDMLLERAVPIWLNDHLIVPRDNPGLISRAMTVLANECAKNSIVISGGETSIHDTARHSQMSITMCGFVIKPVVNKFQNGDALIGVASTGPHANGFTPIRHLYKKALRQEFITPTADYYQHMMILGHICEVHAFVHVTGGAFTKLRSALHRDINAVVCRNHSLNPQPIFHEIRALGISERNMYKTFNCGIGLVIGVAYEHAEACMQFIRKKFDCDIIGSIVSGNGKIIIESKFSAKKLMY